MMMMMMMMMIVVPAMSYDWPSCIRGCHRFDSSHEKQQWRRMIWNAMIRPCCELELTNFQLLWTAILNKRPEYGK